VFQAPQAQVGEEAENSNKTFLGQVEMCVQNFMKIGAGVWISTFISPNNLFYQIYLIHIIVKWQKVFMILFGKKST